MERHRNLPAEFVWGVWISVLTFAVVVAALEWIVPASPSVIVDGDDIIYLKGDHSRPWLTFAAIGCVFAMCAGVWGAFWRRTRPE